MTDLQEELPAWVRPSPGRRAFRWFAVTGTVALLASALVGYIGVLFLAVGALCLLAGLLVGTHILPPLSKPHSAILDFVLFAVAIVGMCVVSSALLQYPATYWLYWAGLVSLGVNAAFAVRRARARLLLCVLLLAALFVIPLAYASPIAIARAVESQSTAHARLFLRFGADANQRKQHLPLLWIAVMARDARTARLLLDKGADPNSKAGPFLAGTPVLSAAASLGDVELVRLLLDYGAAPNLSNSWGETPLARAARAGQLEAAKLLVGRGADPTQADHEGKLPSVVARESQHIELERFLAR